jgi:hypothetical protein
MSDKDLKKLSDIANEKVKAGVTKEEALKSFVAAGIMNDKGRYTKPYAILETVVKNS